MKQKPKIKKDKLKLKPTLKEKRHYLVVEVLSSEKLNEQDIKNKIESSIKNFIGVLGLASAGPLFVKIDERKTKEITSVNSDSSLFSRRYLITLSITTKYVDYVKAGFMLWKDKNFRMKCVGVSGTLKKSERFL
jgi:RNase P/RNase MRP subunit POP5